MKKIISFAFLVSIMHFSYADNKSSTFKVQAHIADTCHVQLQNATTVTICAKEHLHVLDTNRFHHNEIANFYKPELTIESGQYQINTYTYY